MVMEVVPGGDHDERSPVDGVRSAGVNMLLRLEGSLPCTEAGCGAVTGIACVYMDRRSRVCRTAWCPAHRFVVQDQVYCRRHAGVVSAMFSADPQPTAPFPDVDNRAPSLVAWVARQIDAEVWRLLLTELDLETGGQLLADPVNLIHIGIERTRAWERAWKLVTYVGVSRRVSLLVEEPADSVVLVRVAGNVVDRAVPPWITHRQSHERVPDDIDARERQAFNQRLVAAIAGALRVERERINPWTATP